MRLIFTIIINLLLEVCLSNGQVVTLREPKSKIRGHVLKSFLGRDYYAFQDIPYATPPLGEYRYAEPKPHVGWEGILNTTSNSKVCKHPGDPSTTEDCLVMNVYTPVLENNTNLPVLVWIPGGAFEHGSAEFPSNNPQHFLDKDVVIVSFNYRVGAFGFLTTEDGIIPGNLGLKDQVLALKWINKNIAVFGGDPKKVTLSGQSAGSISISFHILSQKSTDLYRAAIMESGTALLHGSFVEHARNYSFQLGRNLDKDFTSNDSKELLKLLRKASAEDILTAASKVQALDPKVGLQPDLFWAVVIEDKNDKNALITEHMNSAFEKEHFDKVPILLGFTSQELIGMARNVEGVKQEAAKLDESPANLIHAKWHIPEKDRPAAGEKLKRLYTNKTFLEDLEAYVSYSSDISFPNPVTRQADLASKFVPVYLYQFSYEGSVHTSVNISGADGVAHAEELNYIWFTRHLNETDLVITKRLVTMWTNFVNDLNPTPTADATLGIPIWPRVTPNNLVYMDIDSNLTFRKNPKHYLGFKAVFDQYMKPPYDVY